MQIYRKMTNPGHTETGHVVPIPSPNPVSTPLLTSYLSLTLPHPTLPAPPYPLFPALPCSTLPRPSLLCPALLYPLNHTFSTAQRTFMFHHHYQLVFIIHHHDHISDCQASLSSFIISVSSNIMRQIVASEIFSLTTSAKIGHQSSLRSLSLRS